MITMSNSTRTIGALLAVAILLSVVMLVVVLPMTEEQPSAPQTEVVDIGQTTAHVYGHNDSIPNPETEVITVEYTGSEPRREHYLETGTTIDLESYTEGDYESLGVWMVGIDNSVDHAENSVTVPGWNRDRERKLDPNETGTYAFWATVSNESFTTTVDGEPAGVASSVHDFVSTNRCEIVDPGMPRPAYENVSTAENTSFTDRGQQFTVGGWSGSVDEATAREDCPAIAAPDGLTVDPYAGELDLDAMGHLQPNDVGIVVWSPPNVDQARVIARHKIK